jgi:hypothetical protein
MTTFNQKITQKRATDENPQLLLGSMLGGGIDNAGYIPVLFHIISMTLSPCQIVKCQLFPDSPLAKPVDDIFYCWLLRGFHKKDLLPQELLYAPLLDTAIE